MKKVAIYIRVSTQEQADEGYSIGAQKEKLINYCKAMSWNIYDIYIDGGFSGSNIKRPGMEKMLNELGNVDLVLVYKLDRLSRSQKDTLYLIEDKFLANNVDFVSMTENFDTTTPLGRAMIGILSVFAQLERENIKERITTGRIERAKSGLWVGGPRPPIGYDYIDGNLVINEYEAMQVKEIFYLYLKGWGQEKITNHFIKKGYTTKYGSWNNTSTHTIYRLIQNRVYIGDVSFNGVYSKGLHEPIIDENTFNRAQESYNKRISTSTRSKHLLTGLLFCSKCGARYTTDKKRNLNYYMCINRKRGYKEGVTRCDNKIWRVEQLDEKVVNKLKSVTKNKTGIKKIYDEITGGKSQNNNKVIEDRIADIEKQITKLMDLYQLDKLPVSVISERIDKLYNEKKELEGQIVGNEVYSDMPTFEEVYNYLKDFNKIWDKLSTEEQKAFINGFVSEIKVNDDKINVGYSSRLY